jgi:hypothetical protein
MGAGVAALALGGVTYVTSSGIAAKLLSDLDWIGNRETPVVLSLLVMEDLAMALYLPILTAVLAGTGLLGGTFALVVAAVAVAVVLFVALRHGRVVEAFIDSPSQEVLLLKVLGLTVLVAGLAQRLQVSAAVGAFLVGIALSGPLAHTARELLTPLRDLFAAVFFVFFGLQTDPADLPPVAALAVGLAVVGIGTKYATGWLSARRVGIGRAGRVRAGAALIPAESSTSSSPDSPSPPAPTPGSDPSPPPTCSSWPSSLRWPPAPWSRCCAAAPPRKHRRRSRRQRRRGHWFDARIAHQETAGQKPGLRVGDPGQRDRLTVI